VMNRKSCFVRSAPTPMRRLAFIAVRFVHDDR
jgi:hypothetical protein